MENQMEIDLEEELAIVARPNVLTPEDIERIRQGLNSQDQNQKLIAARQIRRFLQINNVTDEDFRLIINEGFLPKLAECLESENPALQMVAAWIFTAASASRHNGAFVISSICEKNGLDADTVNLILDSILKSYSLFMKMKIPDINTICLAGTTYLVLKKLCPVRKILNQNLLLKFPGLMNNAIIVDRQICTAVLALSSLISFSTTVEETELILTYSNTKASTDTLAELRDLLNCAVNQNNGIIKQFILSLLSSLVRNNRPNVYLQQIIDVNLMPIILETLKTATVENYLRKIAIQLQKTGMYLIKNYTCYGSNVQIEYLLGCDLMPAICKLLNSKRKGQILKLILVSMYNILCAISSMDMAEEKKQKFFDSLKNGWDKIEKLQTSKDIGISDPTKQLLSEYQKVVKENLKFESSSMDWEESIEGDDNNGPKLYFYCTRGPTH